MAFILGLILFIGLNLNNAYHILYVHEIPKGYLGGRLSDSEYEKLQEITDLDRKILIKVNKKPDAVLIREALAEEGLRDKAPQDLAVSRIIEKCHRLSYCKFKWYELLLCILLFLLGYQIPVLSLRFLKSVRRIDMEEEAAQFQTIILMLKDMSRTHVEEILEWIEMFSVQFKEPIQKCLANFSSGSEEALDQLKEDVPLLLLLVSLKTFSLPTRNWVYRKLLRSWRMRCDTTRRKGRSLMSVLLKAKEPETWWALCRSILLSHCI